MFKKLIIGIFLATTLWGNDLILDFKKGDEFKNLVLTENISDWMIKAKRSHFSIKHKNCKFNGFISGSTLNDDETASLDFIIGDATCHQKDKRQLKHYDISIDKFVHNSKDNKLIAKVIWHPEKRDFEFIVDRNTKMDIKINIVFKEEISTDGNFSFNGWHIDFNNVNNFKISGTASGTSPIADQFINSTGKVYQCNKNHKVFEYKGYGSYDFFCKGNYSFNETVPCSITIYKGASTPKKECEEPKQLKDTFTFNVKLSEPDEVNVVHLPNGDSIKYNYSFISLKRN